MEHTTHPTADVSPLATIGHGTRIWHHAQVREGASIGRDCVLGKGAYIDHGVSIGDNCKIQNSALIYSGATLEDGVFVGPGACVANDRHPRAIKPDGTLCTESDWQQGTVIVRHGVSLGANSTVVPNAVIGEWAMVAAGAVVVGDVPAHGLVEGVPARLTGFVCRCGHRLKKVGESGPIWEMRCTYCGEVMTISKASADGV
jgi:UDP-2-acetamido-3-amino-2,3-dideoxy-glucuronate N-acetyltransferase